MISKLHYNCKHFYSHLKIIFVANKNSSNYEERKNITSANAQSIEGDFETEEKLFLIESENCFLLVKISIFVE